MSGYRFNVCIIFSILLAMLFSACSFPERKRAIKKQPILVDRFRPLPEIRLKDGSDRQFVFSNKTAGFFTGHTHRYNSTNFEGWTVNEVHLLKDYRLFQNGRELKRDRLRAFVLRPYGFERIYANGTVESFVPLDSVDALFIKIKADKGDRLVLNLTDYKEDVSAKTPEVVVKRRSFNGLQLKANYFKTSDGQHYFILRYGKFSADDSISAREIENFEKAAARRKERMEQLLQRYPFFVKNRQVMRALQWSLFSLDALVTRQKGAGIWAGLPWFNNYWGRDTFISFHGALLVSGQFETAKNILRNFARFQMKDENSQELGRIPNRITNNETIYNTADGTWWFIRAIYEYFLYTGDQSFLQEMFPFVRRAIDGAIAKRVDKLGFLTHGDAETWMDAVGSEGPWSPRGNRAVEIQALWYTALQIGARMAKNVEGEDSQGQKWLLLSRKVKDHFNRYYWNETRQALYDHLNADGSADQQIRPNQIFAVTVPDLPGIEPLLTRQRQEAVARFVTSHLTTPYGVLSLWYKDENFHPYHHYLPYYVPDAAYHNGLIWCWLAGPAISGQVKFDQESSAGQVFMNEVDQVLNFDAIGSFAELVEPVLRKGERRPRISGTISQAWSLAEFLRNFYHDLVGYQPIADENRVLFQPHLIDGIDEIRCRVPFKDDHLDVHLQKTATGMKFRLHSNFPHQRIDGYVRFPGDSIPVKIFIPDSGRDFEYEFIAADTTSDSVKLARRWHLAKVDSGLKFATIYEIPFKLLRGKQVFFPIGRNGPTVIYQRDELHDDTGQNGMFTYPENKVFEDGIADLKSLTIYDNDSTWGFRIDLRNLVDPGWHPEYGFQLTFVAIAVNDPTLGGVYSTEVGHQANYRLPNRRKFNRIIYVGGGLEIRDGNDRRIALFVPTDVRHPLGYVQHKQIRFQIPKELLPGLNHKSRITALCGLQDDHGGSGLGDFRAVFENAGQWHGGGARGGHSSAVYDLLMVN
ncbi:amylo-alpha-1,6-glucosidase [Calditrichota bacterium LG25]